MRLVHHRDEPTPVTDRLLVGHLFHLEPLKGRRHAVLSGVIWAGFSRGIVEHVLRQPIRKILRHIAAVVGVGAGLAALDGDAAVSICAGNVCGEVQIEEFNHEQGPVWCVAREAGADRKYLGPVQLSSRLVLSILTSVPAFAPG